MSETSASQAASTRAVQEAASDTAPEPPEGQPEPSAPQLPKWGEFPRPERIAELEARLSEWEQLPQESRGDPAQGKGGRSAFDRGGPQAWQGDWLTGADVFYLAARALAGSAEPAAIDAGVLRLAMVLRRVTLSGGFLDLSADHLDLSALHLEGAYLAFAQLELAHLAGAHLEGADLTYLEGAYLAFAHLENANLIGARLEGAQLYDTHLEGASLSGAYLEDAGLGRAHLENANLNSAHLEGADLRLASLSAETALDNIALVDAAHGSVRLADVRWGGANLSVVDWEPLRVLGDETQARQRRDSWGQKKDRATRLDEYKAAVRANRQLAVALQTQGLSEDAARFAYRAQLLQRRVFRLQGFRKFGAYLFSLLIAALAGYGYRLWHIVVVYALVVVAFAVSYYLAGMLLPGEQRLTEQGALLLSVTNIHGRVFTGVFQLDTVQAWFAAGEAVSGIVIEGTFVAMLIQRFFGR